MKNYHLCFHISDVEKAIGQNVAPLVDDDATPQMGIESIPEADFSIKKITKDLGVYQ